MRRLSRGLWPARSAHGAVLGCWRCRTHSVPVARPRAGVVDEEPRSGKRKKRAAAEEGESRVRRARAPCPGVAAALTAILALGQDLATTKVQSSGSGARSNAIIQRGVTTSIKLDNNELGSLEGLQAVIKEVMPAPERLTWLDLSCNCLTTVDQVRAARGRSAGTGPGLGRTGGRRVRGACLTAAPHRRRLQDLVNCENLTSLYLHANDIKTLKEIKKLGNLTKLKSLTLHGNPVEEVKNYRSACASAPFRSGAALSHNARTRPTL